MKQICVKLSLILGLSISASLAFAGGDVKQDIVYDVFYNGDHAKYKEDIEALSFQTTDWTDFRHNLEYNTGDNYEARNGYDHGPKNYYLKSSSTLDESIDGDGTCSDFLFDVHRRSTETSLENVRMEISNIEEDGAARIFTFVNCQVYR